MREEDATRPDGVRLTKLGWPSDGDGGTAGRVAAETRAAAPARAPADAPAAADREEVAADLDPAAPAAAEGHPEGRRGHQRGPADVNGVRRPGRGRDLQVALGRERDRAQEVDSHVHLDSDLNPDLNPLVKAGKDLDQDADPDPRLDPELDGDREAELEAEPDEEPPLHPIGALVSFHYLRAAVRRHRRFVAALAALGMVLGGAFLLVAPASHTARIAIILSHASGDDPNRAMATDIALLASRTVAEHTLQALSLDLTPEQVTKSVTVLPSTSDVLDLTMEAPTSTEAVRRLSTFTTIYLNFRATQVSAQTDFMIKGYNKRIALLQAQLVEVDKRIARLSTGAGTPDQLSDAISQRSQVAGQVGTLQDSVNDASLRRSAMVTASRVIDPAHAQPGGGTLRVALAVMSGLIGGTALALAIVVLRALLTDRLRLRVEVASALEAPVLVSVGPLAPPSRLWLPHHRRARATRRQADLRRVGIALTRALAGTDGPGSLVLGCVENAEEAAYALGAVSDALQAAGRQVELVDLTESGALERAAGRGVLGPRNGPAPTVTRPDMIPSLSAVPPDLAAGAGSRVPADPAGGARLVLADLDPAIGADLLTEWADRVVVAVTAGRSGVVRLRTTGDVVRSAGLELHGVVVLRAEPDDDSSGLPPTEPTQDMAGGAVIPIAGSRGAAAPATDGDPARQAARRFS
ncbi:MAG TPA: hypothetical protein VI248_01420 [Kineosporiaceae bacterium]